MIGYYFQCHKIRARHVAQVLEGFKALRAVPRTKRIMMTMSKDAQLQAFLTVMMKEGERGRLQPGLEQEMRVRLETMMRRSMEIIVLDVDPESDENLVRQAMGKCGKVQRCERMRMSGIFHRVVVNKVKVELVRNKVRLPNIRARTILAISRRFLAYFGLFWTI